MATNPVEYLRTCDHLLSPAEVAKLLGLHRETLYRYKDAGKIRHVCVGRKVMFDPGDVLEYLQRL